MMFSEVQLEKIKIAITEKVSNELMDVVVRTEEIADDFICNRLTLMVHGYVWGESGETQTICYPATWWDAVKERWFPAWLNARYPIRYREYEISLKTLYPNFKISLPRETHVLKYVVHNRLAM
jgi:hypothetical protein